MHTIKFIHTIAMHWNLHHNISPSLSLLLEALLYTIGITTMFAMRYKQFHNGRAHMQAEAVHLKGSLICCPRCIT